MKLSNYARIGNALVLQATGVQSNYKETKFFQRTVQDFDSPECCMCSDAERKFKCDTCPYAKYKTIFDEKPIYVNEVNRYGNLPRTSKITTLLLLFFHYCYPDRNGIVKDVSFADTAKFLGVTERSVCNSASALEDFGYITVSNGSEKGLKMICIKGYSELGLTAKEGGRGYFTINLTFLKEMIKVKNVVSLRIYLRAMSECDADPNGTTDIDNKKFRRFLPSYCKPGVIARSLENNKTESYFIKKNKDGYNFVARLASRGRQCYDNAVDFCKSVLYSFSDRISKLCDETARCYTNGEHVNPVTSNELKSYGIKPYPLSDGNFIFRNPYFNDKDIEGLSVIAALYSVDIVKEGLSSILPTYIDNERRGSVASLVRTWIRRVYLSS